MINCFSSGPQALGRRVVVTGGAGFIGSHLTQALLTCGLEVHVLDDLSAGQRKNLPQSHPQLTFDKITLGKAGDDYRILDQAVAAADIVLHLASPIGVRRAHEHRLDICQSILCGGIAVVEACRKHRKSILVSSSSEVYGAGQSQPLRETDLIALGMAPRWGYAAGKFALEHLVLGLQEETDLPCWVVRFFNIAGARQRPETGLCIATFVQAAREGRPLVVYGNGLQQRAFLHVEDAVSGVLAVITNLNLAGRPVNIGGKTGISIAHVAREVVRLVNCSSEVHFRSVQDVFGSSFSEAMIRVPDLSLIFSNSGWIPRRPLQDMIIDCHKSLE